MNIQYLNENSFRGSDLKFIKLIQSDLSFETAIRTIRTIAEIPTNGYKIKIVNGKLSLRGFSEAEQDKLISNWVAISQGIDDVIKTYNLPYYWWETLFTIIVFNFAVYPTKEDTDIEYIYTGGLNGILRKLGKLNNIINLNQDELIIKVKRGMSFNSLIESLRTDRKQIEKYLSSLDSDPEIRDSHIEVKSRINELRNKGLSYFKIGDIIDGEFDTTNFLDAGMTEETTKTYHKRTIKTLNRLTKSNRSLKKYLK